MKKTFLTIALSGFCAMALHAQSHTPTTELLKNPSFEEEAKPIRNRRFGPNGEGELFGGYLPAGIIPGWIIPDNKEEESKISITTEGTMDSTQHRALCWEIAQVPASITNVGVNGIEAIKGHTYTLTFWVRADKHYTSKLQVGLQNKAGDTWYAHSTMRVRIKRHWKKYTLTFTSVGDDEQARLAIVSNKRGTLFLDCMSLTVLE